MMDIPSTSAGKLQKLHVAVGDRVSEGELIATLLDSSAGEVDTDTASRLQADTQNFSTMGQAQGRPPERARGTGYAIIIVELIVFLFAASMVEDSVGSFLFLVLIGTVVFITTIVMIASSDNKKGEQRSKKKSELLQEYRNERARIREEFCERHGFRISHRDDSSEEYVPLIRYVFDGGAACIALFPTGKLLVITQPEESEELNQVVVFRSDGSISVTEVKPVDDPSRVCRELNIQELENIEYEIETVTVGGSIGSSKGTLTGQTESVSLGIAVANPKVLGAGISRSSGKFAGNFQMRGQAKSHEFEFPLAAQIVLTPNDPAVPVARVRIYSGYDLRTVLDASPSTLARHAFHRKEKEFREVFEILRRHWKHQTKNG
jgi:hypothetical protein